MNSDVEKYLNCLDARPCQCQVMADGIVFPLCQHVIADPSLYRKAYKLYLELKDHKLSLEEWAVWLWRNHKKDYRDRPLPPRLPPREDDLKKDDRISIYAQRLADGHSLYRDDDIWRKTEALKVGVEVERIRNGSVAERRIV